MLRGRVMLSMASRCCVCVDLDMHITDGPTREPAVEPAEPDHRDIELRDLQSRHQAALWRWMFSETIGTSPTAL